MSPTVQITLIQICFLLSSHHFLHPLKMSVGTKSKKFDERIFISSWKILVTDLTYYLHIWSGKAVSE